MSCTSKLLSLSICVLALAATGCSEEVPPAGEGAFSLTFQGTATAAGASCTIKTHNSQIGYADTTKIGELKKDSVAGAQVQCSVIDNGSFTIEGFIGDGVRSLNVNIAGLTLDASEAQPANGTVAFSSPDTAKVYTSPNDTPCVFWFGGDNQKSQIAPGRAWIDFRCDQVANASTNSSCAISLGTVAFQNCEQ